MTSRRAATRGMVFLPVGRRRRHQRVVSVGQRHHQCCQRLGQLRSSVFVAFGMKHLGDAVELGGRVGGGLGILAGDQHVDVAPIWVAVTDGLCGLVGQEAWSCSAIKKPCLYLPFPRLQHACFVLQLVDQFGDNRP
jgi:hypothetical protein